MEGIRRSFVRWFGACAISTLLAACSADEGAMPEPEVTTPGVFLGVRNPDENVTIVRVLQALVSDRQVLMTITVYAPDAPNLDAARRMARQRDLEVADAAAFVALTDLGEPEVLWFRTLTEEEQANAL